jgi:hypothetical protein
MVGDGIREKRDAEWLAMEMSHVAGVKPAASIPVDNRAEELDMILAFAEDLGGRLTREKAAEIREDVEDSHGWPGRASKTRIAPLTPICALG